MKDVKSLKKGEQSFTANGKKYTIKNKISITRWKEYEKLVPQLTLGIGFDEMFKGLRKAYGHLNNPKPKPLDAGVVLHGIMSGITDVSSETRMHPALKMAALVIDREGEDPTKYDEELMKEKISDWEKEGMDMVSFFHLSLKSIQGFNEQLIKFTKEVENHPA